MAQRGGGKRRGARKADPPPRRFRKDVFVLALATTVAVVAWGYLVYAAIDFGTDARGGEGRAWAFLALAAVGATACLFAALMLLARTLRALTGEPISRGSEASDRPPGSHQRDR